MDTSLETLAREMERRGKALAFTGSGISAESGIPTFRGEGGIWERYPPAVYGNLPGLFSAFLFRPARLARFFSEALTTFAGAEPNPAHHALAELERRGRLGAVITQNIDDLHERAGNGLVLKLHGDLYRFRCLSCRARRQVAREDLFYIMRTLGEMKPARRNLIRFTRTSLPACPRCGGRMRPDVVFFGESLPPEAASRALSEVSSCRVMLVVGTSGVVYPAASYPRIAKENGALLAEFGPEPTEITPLCDHFFRGRASETLPRLLARIPPRPSPSGPGG